MLELQQVQAFYGATQVLRGVDLTVQPGEIVALLGRNGAGRSTTARAIMGLVQARGSVRWRGAELIGRLPYEIARAGLGYVPESRDIFPRLTVHQNLLLGQKPGQSRQRWGFDDMYRLFPQLKAREHTEGGLLSGGEQQMLTLCRTLMGDPELLIVDEPTEGLAPQLVDQVRQFLRALQERGVSVLLIEQKLTMALDIANRCLVMGQGRIVFDGSPGGLLADAAMRQEWLQV